MLSALQNNEHKEQAAALNSPFLSAITIRSKVRSKFKLDQVSLTCDIYSSRREDLEVTTLKGFTRLAEIIFTFKPEFNTTLKSSAPEQTQLL